MLGPVLIQCFYVLLKIKNFFIAVKMQQNLA